MMQLLSKIKTTKLLLPAVLSMAVASTAVQAHDNCDVDLEAGFSINQSTIKFLDQHDKPLYTISNDESLMVQGKEIELNQGQQALVTRYSSSIRAIVPKAQAEALEGVDLAIEGVNLAFNELLGEGNSLGRDLTLELDQIRAEINTRMSAEHGFSIGANGIDNGEFLGEDFEQRIESVVEKAVMNSMGSLLVALGQEMMFAGGDVDAFEARMENFGENIEQQMQVRAEKIEHQALALCHAITEIDQLEEQMKAQIKQLADINVISVNKHKVTESNNKQLM